MSRALAPLLAASLVLGGCTNTLDADALARAERGLAALGAEANMLVEQFERGELTGTYASVHCDKLLEQQRELAGDLDDAAPTALAARADAARDAAERLGRALRHVGDALARGAPVAAFRDDIGAAVRTLPPAGKKT
jgi:outer membrane murein-binding lipoprotein Lpp